jgi:site-specific recombinase XerD
MAQRNFKRKLSQELFNQPELANLHNTAMKARRVESRSELEVDLRKLEDYMENGKKRSASKSTLNGFKSKAITIFNMMEHIEYSRDFIREYRHKLDEKEMPAASQYIYLAALQELFRAVLDDPEYHIARPQVKIDNDDTGKYFNAEEMERLFNSVDITNIYGIRDKAILSCLYFAALRNNECTHLYLDDVDIAGRSIKIQSHGTWHTKSYHNRKLNLPDIAIDYIKAWILIREREGFDKLVYPTLFICADGTPMQDYSLREVVWKYCEKAGLKGYPHKLRHSRCSYLANIARWPLAELKYFMGHSDISVTMRYVHSCDENQRKLVDNTKEIRV